MLRTWIFWTLIVAALLSIKMGIPENWVDVLTLAISSGVGAVLSLLVALGFTILRLWKSLRPGDGVLGEHVFELRDDGLYERTSVNETLSNWSGIKNVEETRRFAFVAMKNNTFHIIPRSDFGSKEHANEFLAELRRRVKNSA